jgi:hypothetical protein
LRWILKRRLVFVCIWETHGDVFDIASKRLEEGYGEDKIFHVDFFRSD